jgi:hypothetical protein
MGEPGASEPQTAGGEPCRICCNRASVPDLGAGPRCSRGPQPILRNLPDRTIVRDKHVGSRTFTKLSTPSPTVNR